MKITCPHCGAHGVVDDSFAEKKLRCPQCNKVFLVAVSVGAQPETGDVPELHQERLHESDEISKIAEVNLQEEEISTIEDVVEPELSVDIDDAEVEEENLTLEINEIEEEEEDFVLEIEEDMELEEELPVSVTEKEIDIEAVSDLVSCSACKQLFAPEFLVEVDAKLYCALCQPESEDGLELYENGDDVVVNQEDDFLDIVDDNSMANEEDLFAEEDLLEFMDEEGDNKFKEEQVALEKCSSCGELLHPDFLDTVNGQRFCAFCEPKDEDEYEEALELEIVDGETERETGLLGGNFDDLEVDNVGQMPSNYELDEDNETDAETGDSVKESCTRCGEKFHRDFMMGTGSNRYCGVCQSDVVAVATGSESNTATSMFEKKNAESCEPDTDFTVGDLIKEAWQKTKGAKAAIWGGTIVMNLILFVISIGGMYAFETLYKGTDSTIIMGGAAAFQVATSWLSMIMTGGLILIGVRRAFEQRVSWKMVFAGFSKALSITIAVILQIILVCIGFVLLIIPGIYLTVAYCLTLPLIIDKGMGPWEALEASRKAVHKKWWTVLGMYFVMMLLYLISIVPLGLGLIWTVPMFFVLTGVLYFRLFGEEFEYEEDE